MTEPIVYGYLDLAERGSGMRYVLTSTGTTVGLNEDQWRRVDRDGETMLCNCDIVYVRGALALEVAEREVREAVEPFRNGRTFVSCKCVQSETHVIWLDEAPSHIGREVYQEQSRVLWRAVDIRDRLRAKFVDAKPAKPKRYAKVYMNTAKRDANIDTGRDALNSGNAWQINFDSVAGGIQHRSGFSDETYQRIARGEEVPIECSDDKADWYWIAEPRVVAPARHAVGTGNVAYATSYVGGTGNVASFSVEYARRSNVCRLCGLPPERGPGLPFVYTYGREYAHEACLKQKYMHAKPATVDITVNLDTSKAIAALEDLRQRVKRIGREFEESINQEVKPMPTVYAKPDPHAECRLSLRGGVLVDDYGRTLGVGASVEASTNCGRLWLTVTVPHSDVPPDGAARPAPAPPEPVFIESEKLIPTTERERIASELTEKLGRPVVVLMGGLRRAAKPIDEQRATLDSIQRRAELAAASRKALRVGGVLGLVAGLALACASFGAVAKLKPEWLARLAPCQHAAADRVLDSEDARTRTKEGSK